MSSNMSRRDPPLDPPAVDPLDVDPDVVPEVDPDSPVEYFVVVLESLPWSISVPKSTHSSHTLSSAPSIFAVFGVDVSAPHISHWTMLSDFTPTAIKRVLGAVMMGPFPDIARLQRPERPEEPLERSEVPDDREHGE
jgi:hypothetical protein